MKIRNAVPAICRRIEDAWRWRVEVLGTDTPTVEQIARAAEATPAQVVACLGSRCVGVPAEVRQ